VIVSWAKKKPKHCSKCRDHLVPVEQADEGTKGTHEPLSTLYLVCPTRLSEGDKSHDAWVLKPYDTLWALHLGESK
jgi:hypothetical protein